jgi:NAD(P)-dependent dehydrogenase (short-subunit alcohol dehydrogenase family)
MSPRIVLITGCTKGGMGFYLAEEFAKKGCIVYASARRLDSMKELTHDNIRRVVLDVTSDEGVLNVVQKILEKEGRTDILVSNAGAHCGGTCASARLDVNGQRFTCSSSRASPRYLSGRGQRSVRHQFLRNRATDTNHSSSNGQKEKRHHCGYRLS